MNGWLHTSELGYCVHASYFEAVQKDTVTLVIKQGYEGSALVQYIVGNLNRGITLNFILPASGSTYFLSRQDFKSSSKPALKFDEAMNSHQIVVSPQNIHGNHFIAVCIVHSHRILEVCLVPSLTAIAQLTDHRLCAVYYSKGPNNSSVCYCDGLFTIDYSFSFSL
jgi:hypothetical protein